jgi:hypothetical protein
VYGLAYCYDSSATNKDVFNRTVEPFINRVIDGCNVNVIVQGSTGSGKGLLLEGGDDEKDENMSGLVHYALDHLFKKLHACSMQVRSQGIPCATTCLQQPVENCTPSN